MAKPENTSKGIKVRWSQKAGAKGYKLYKSTNAKKHFKRIKTIKRGSATSYLDKKVKATKAYYYKLRAYSFTHKISKAASSGSFTFYHCYSGKRWYKIGKDIPRDQYIGVSTSGENGLVTFCSTKNIVANSANSCSILSCCRIPTTFMSSDTCYLEVEFAKLYLASEVKKIPDVTSVIKGGYYKHGGYTVGVDIPAGNYCLKTQKGCSALTENKPSYFANCLIDFGLNGPTDNMNTVGKDETKYFTVTNGQNIKLAWGKLKKTD
jgi:hypothetical protein